MIDKDTDIGKGLFSRKSKLLLACSGGPDSVCLFHLLLNNGYQFSVAHVNYHLRGEESEDDEAFVRKLCKENNINIYLKSVEMPKGRSIQQEAREIRYAFFNEIITSKGYDYLLTAHHQNDLIENSLFRFMRGSGLRGLVSFGKIKGNIIRPLLDLSKKEIVAYLNDHELTYRVDYSNLNSDYTRNKIRNKVLPGLEKDLPNIEQRIAHTHGQLKSDFSLINALMAPYKEQLKLGNLEIKCSDSISHETSFWFYLLEHITTDQGRQIANASFEVSNGFNIQINGYSVSIIKDAIHVNAMKDAINGPILIDEINDSNYYLGDDTQIYFDSFTGELTDYMPEKLYISADKLDYPIQLRHPKIGDRFQPLGMQGHKLVSDFYNDVGLSVSEKGSKWILVNSNDDIIAVLPYRISESYRVDETTQLGIRISMCKKD